MRYFAIIVLSILFCTNSFAFEYDTNCIDNAKTNHEVEKCGNKIVPSMEMSIKEKFNRLDKKYYDNKEMKELLRLTKQSWINYKNLLCNFEGAVVAGGQTSGILPLEANKAYLKCAIKLLEEMDKNLTKWEQLPLK